MRFVEDMAILSEYGDDSKKTDELNGIIFILMAWDRERKLFVLDLLSSNGDLRVWKSFINVCFKCGFV